MMRAKWESIIFLIIILVLLILILLYYYNILVLVSPMDVNDKLKGKHISSVLRSFYRMSSFNQDFSPFESRF